ncbi:alpha/beta hydrolase [Tropicibacter sp. R15_0]|uniref:alpha/beta hydrolase n=1 Tax=Tropicibacter sp. R15_0 TaxID=2821101 RepID=UPI001ADBFF64|nr:alpha/beta hydrolase [Tropicibacter sp. R15_0]MBO9467288.1 alpha/beta hydrolase [Tropicibacter sp. R15_0]
MPMLRISDVDNQPCLHGASSPLLPTLRHALSLDDGPVTIMIHGFKYQPGAPGFCPHDGIFSRTPLAKTARTVSWPRHLGLRGQNGEGLGISFGWSARGNIWAAYDRAALAGQSLARLVGHIHQLSPCRKVRLVAHSLGARVALHTIRNSHTKTITHAVLLAAAEFGGPAKDALDCENGWATQVLNVSSRENDLYDFLLERLVKRSTRTEKALGHGCTRLPNMATLQLDDPNSLSALKAAGYPIAKPQKRICHWSPYLRPGVFPLYRAFLTGRLPLARLQAILPSVCEPRWSRLLPRQSNAQTRFSNRQQASF